MALRAVEEHSPAVIKELKPEVVKTGTLRRVLANLVSEKIPIGSLDVILESVAHHGVHFKDPEQLCDQVRSDLGHIICERFLNPQRELQVVMIDPKLEAKLREAMHEGNMALAPRPLETLLRRLQDEWEKFAVQDQNVAVLTDFQMRRPLRNAIFRALPDLSVISFTEIPKDMAISPVAYLKLEEIFDMDPQSIGGMPNLDGLPSMNTNQPEIATQVA